MTPEYLYHYTSVDTLELILTNKTIRFNSLEKMDDKLEQWTAHGNQEGKQYFISSWTDAQEEIPDMWKQYCKNGPESGVRIKLPVNPFSLTENELPGGIAECTTKTLAVANHLMHQLLGRELSDDILTDLALLRNELNKHPDLKAQFHAFREMLSHTTVECHTRELDHLLFQVQYTNDPNYIFPTLYMKYQGLNIGDFSRIAKYKDTSWKWQREWRYCLQFNMVTPGIMHDDGTIDLYPLPFDHYDLILDTEKLAQMEIALSPVISTEARNKVYRIIAEHNPTAIIHESQLDRID